MKKVIWIAALLMAVLILICAALVKNYIKFTDGKMVFIGRGLAAENEKKQGISFVDALVTIDPGHGGDEPGTINYGMVEKDINLDISLRLEKLLNDAGVTTQMTRREDKTVGLRKRAEMANSAAANLFISVHNNYLPGYPDFGGTETLYAFPDNPILSKIDSKRLARIVQDEVTSKLGTKDLKLIYRPELAVLHRTNMPSVIAEISYMSNKAEGEKLSKAEFRQKAAEALRDAVLKALDEDGAMKDKNGRWVYRKTISK